MNKKKMIIISTVAIIVIAVITVLTYFLLKGDSSSEEEEKIAWQEAYKTYLSGKIPNTVNYPNLEMQLVYFCDEEIPVLLIRYDYEDSKFIDMNLVDETGKTIAGAGTSGIGKLKVLYNKESEKYEWFICREYQTYYAYTNLEDFVESARVTFASNGTDNSVEIEEYTIYKTATNKSTREKEFEAKYIDTNSEDLANNWISFNTDDYKYSLSNLIKDEANKNKKADTVITEEIKSNVSSKIEADKKAEEEAKAKQEAVEKAAAEEASKRLKVGSHTLKYGKYTAIMPDGPTVITLNSDGTCKYVGIDPHTGNGNYDVSGTYKVIREDIYGYGDIDDGIRLTLTNNMTITYCVSSNNSFGSDWQGFNYSGN